MPAIRAGPRITSRSPARSRGRTHVGSAGVSAARSGSRSQASRDALRRTTTSASRSRSTAASRRASACASAEAPWETTSSAWSSRRTTRPPRAARRRSTARAMPCSSASTWAASIPGSKAAIARATRRSGSLPGSTTGRTIVPSRRARRGSTPALTRDDLPLPDGPTTRSGCGRGRASRSSTWAISRSRPKSTAAWSSVNRDRPGYGDRPGSHVNGSPGGNPSRVSDDTSWSTSAARSAIGPTTWRSARIGWGLTAAVMTWTASLPSATAIASSVWHQRDSSEVGVARKTTMSDRSRLAYSSWAQPAPPGIPASGSLSRKTDA